VDRLSSTAFCSSPIPTITRHVHGFYSETGAIVDLRLDGTVALSKRKDAVGPSNARRSDVKKILNVAALHFAELAELWEDVHGRA
jgi:hypothetical protein